MYLEPNRHWSDCSYYDRHREELLTIAAYNVNPDFTCNPYRCRRSGQLHYEPIPNYVKDSINEQRKALQS